MNFYVMTLFPDMIASGLSCSITGRAMKKGLINVEAVNIRDFAFNRHNSVDDYPYGGGAGMVMQAEPIDLCHQDIVRRSGDGNMRVVYMSPKGKTFNQAMAQELSGEENLCILCGHYEGVDQRVIDRIVTDEVSIGDYVLTGGELPAMVLIDAVSRLVPGVLHNDDSAVYESFLNGLLEYPQYSRPEEYKGDTVPEVLLSGDHDRVEEWRLEKSLEITREKRPDLFDQWNRDHPGMLDSEGNLEPLKIRRRKGLSADNSWLGTTGNERKND